MSGITKVIKSKLARGYRIHRVWVLGRGIPTEGGRFYVEPDEPAHILHEDLRLVTIIPESSIASVEIVKE